MKRTTKYMNEIELITFGLKIGMRFNNRDDGNDMIVRKIAKASPDSPDSP